MGAQISASDSVLVQRAAGGDAEAFGQLVERYMRAAYAVAFAVTGHHHDAEDVTQSSFLVALGRLEECRSPEKFAAWFLAIVRNRARNLLRRESVRATDGIPASTPSRLPDPASVSERGELRQSLVEALKKLTPIQREVVLLHDLQGWKHREIAERLGLPSGTVRSHLHFARKELRKLLSPGLLAG